MKAKQIDQLVKLQLYESLEICSDSNSICVTIKYDDETGQKTGLNLSFNVSVNLEFNYE